MPHTSANNRSRFSTGAFAAKRRRIAGMFINALNGSRFNSRALPRNDLDEYFCRTASQKPRRRYTAGQQTARRAVGDRRHQCVCNHSHAAIRMRQSRYYARGNFSVMTRPCASSVVCGGTPAAAAQSARQQR
ncbi:hypothetical protein KCP71_15055 [Salmonella enterica subsp. enterica]|nr:hypothetical protein KCP71_15055 [Salmonella enterica subsp. enterica]